MGATRSVQPLGKSDCTTSATVQSEQHCKIPGGDRYDGAGRTVHITMRI